MLIKICSFVPLNRLRISHLFQNPNSDHQISISLNRLPFDNINSFPSQMKNIGTCRVQVQLYKLHPNTHWKLQTYFIITPHAVKFSNQLKPKTDYYVFHRYLEGFTQKTFGFIDLVISLRNWHYLFVFCF